MNFFDRTSRAGYWWVVLLNAVIGVALLILMFFAISGAGTGSSNPFGMGSGVIIFASWPIVNIIPSAAMTVRRLHDTGRSWLYYLFTFIPIAGSVIIVIFVASETRDPFRNRYGGRPQV